MESNSQTKTSNAIGATIVAQGTAAQGTSTRHRNSSQGVTIGESYDDEKLWLEAQLHHLAKEYDNLDETENKLLSVLHQLQQDDGRIGDALGVVAEQDNANVNKQLQQSQRNQKEREALELMEKMLMTGDDDESDNDSKAWFSNDIKKNKSNEE